MPEHDDRWAMFVRAELQFSSHAEQIMGMPALRKRHWTAADVRSIIDESRHWPRYELLDGELLVTPAPTPAHQIAIGELFTSLFEYCKREDIGIALMSPADIELAPETIMQPDIFVVPNDVIPADEPLVWPNVSRLLLAVEVLSPSTFRRDRVAKRDFYLANGVEEYWIVDASARIFERWTSTRDTPDLRADRLAWRPPGSSAPFVLDVPAFFHSNRALPRT